MFERVGLGILPLMLGFITVSAFVATYIIAVANDHVEPVFPYISDTGTTTPESCIFSQFLNIAAAIAVIVIFVRYRMVRHFVNETMPSVRRLNTFSLFLGILSALGMSMVANFQESAVGKVHFTGAGMVFGFGTGYALLNALITYKMSPDYNGAKMAHWRLALALLSLVFMISTFVGGAVGVAMWNNDPPARDDRQHWKPGDSGYGWHLVSTFSEWLMSLCFLLFFFTYTNDFGKLRLSIETTVLVFNLDDELPNERTGLLT